MPHMPATETRARRLDDSACANLMSGPADTTRLPKNARIERRIEGRGGRRYSICEATRSRCRLRKPSRRLPKVRPALPLDQDANRRAAGPRNAATRAVPNSREPRRRHRRADRAVASRLLAVSNFRRASNSWYGTRSYVGVFEHVPTLRRRSLSSAAHLNAQVRQVGAEHLFRVAHPPPPSRTSPFVEFNSRAQIILRATFSFFFRIFARFLIRPPPHSTHHSPHHLQQIIKQTRKTTVAAATRTRKRRRRR